MSENILFHSNAREKMINGVVKLSDAVKVTLGPKGKNVAIVKQRKKPHLTKDGVTVANAISFEDPFENLGASLVKEAAQRTADTAGDGTTTSTVLAANLLLTGHRLLESGHDSKQVIYAFERACFDVMAELDKNRIELDNYEQLVSVATISANGESKLGELIAKAIDRVGADGPVTVEKSKSFETKLDVVDGTVIDQGFMSPYFATNAQKTAAELENVLTLCVNQSLSSLHSILPYLEFAANSNRSLLLIVNDLSAETLQSLVMNKLKGALRVCAIKAPEFGNARSTAFQDIVSVLGGEVLNYVAADKPLEFNENHFGNASKAIVSKNASILIETGGSKDEIELRKNDIISQLKESSLTDSDIGILNRRRNRLSDGIAIIRVGGTTESEMLERKDRVDDALCAAKAAKEAGIQPGGGLALLTASEILLRSFNPNEYSESYSVAYKAFMDVCKEPMKCIINNSGETPEIIIREIKKRFATKKINYNWGYNASSGEFGNMFKMNVIDPHKVVISSLHNALSVACNILSVGCAVVSEDDVENTLGLVESL
jgi:chaperonin GroEL